MSTPKKGSLAPKPERLDWTPGPGLFVEHAAEYIVVAYHPVNNRISFSVSDNEGLLGAMSFCERPDALYGHTPVL
jgi:hypothetical protein